MSVLTIDVYCFDFGCITSISTPPRRSETESRATRLTRDETSLDVSRESSVAVYDKQRTSVTINERLLRGTRATAVDAKGPKKSPFSPLHTPPVWPFCAADGTIRTALALPLREASSFSSEPPQARTATRSLARTTHLPDLPASCWLRLPPPYSITSAAPLALTYVIVKVTSCRTGP